MLVSALGDGMSMVAMAWLAVQIAPLDQAGVWTVLAVAGLLDPVVYVILLAVSSLLHAWGSAGAYTLIAESLPLGADAMAHPVRNREAPVNEPQLA